MLGLRIAPLPISDVCDDDLEHEVGHSGNGRRRDGDERADDEATLYVPLQEELVPDADADDRAERHAEHQQGDQPVEDAHDELVPFPELEGRLSNNTRSKEIMWM